MQNKYRAELNASAHSFAEANHLYTEVAEHLFEHLLPITIEPQLILDVGTGCGTLLKPLHKHFPQADIVAVDIAEQRLKRIHNKGLFNKPYQLVCADALHLPFADNSVDLVITNLLLHWVDDVPAWLNEVQRVLRPKGLLMLSYYGPDTLRELGKPKQAFIDMHDVGDAIIRAKLNHPILDSEHLTVEYDDYADALADVTANGEIALIDPITSSGPLDVTYEIVYAHAWKEEQPMTSKIDQDGMVRISIDQIQYKA